MSVRFATVTGIREPAATDDLKADRPYRLAVLVKNHTNPAYVSALKAADDVAARLGVEVTHFVPEIADDLDQQNAHLREAIGGGFDGIVITPVETAKQVPLIEEANRAGIPVYNFSNRLEGGEVVCFVGSDDVDVGRSVVSWLAKATGGSVRILLIDGSPSTPTARDRMTGVHAALPAHAGLVVLAEAPAFYDRARARELTAGLLEQHPDADTILALNDEMALGAADALDAAGRAADFRVTGVNGTPAGLEALKAGRIVATVDYALYAIAGLAVEMAVRHLNGEALPSQNVLLPTPVIDGTNVDDAIAQRRSWGIM